MELERIALSDEYFIESKLYTNVDFYSGIIYQAMNIPSQMFTVLFAVARSKMDSTVKGNARRSSTKNYPSLVAITRSMLKGVTYLLIRESNFFYNCIALFK